MLPNCKTVTKPACFLRVWFQVVNACRNHALQIFCNKTGVKNISDVFEISALSCNLITEKSVKKSWGSGAAFPPGQGVEVSSAQSCPETTEPSAAASRPEAQGQRRASTTRCASRVACYKPYSSSAPKTPRRTLDAGCVGGWAGRTPGGWRARSLGCRIKHLLPLETFPLPSGMRELRLYARPGSRKEDRAAEGSVTSFLPWPLSTDKQKSCAAFPNSVPAPAGASQLEL